MGKQILSFPLFTEERNRREGSGFPSNGETKFRQGIPFWKVENPGFSPNRAAGMRNRITVVARAPPYASVMLHMRKICSQEVGCWSATLEDQAHIHWHRYNARGDVSPACDVGTGRPKVAIRPADFHDLTKIPRRKTPLTAPGAGYSLFGQAE